MRQSMGVPASPSGHSAKPEPSSTVSAADAASVPNAGCDFCRDPEGGTPALPMYGVAPHECFWRKGPQFTLGQSTLVPFDDSACFVPDLEQGETWADFKYPSACGIYYCPNCNRDQYARAWASLVARVGQPPLEVATCGGHA